MKSHSVRLTLEKLEDRSVPSTVASGDFNNDGREDIVAITSPTEITVSLANPDGSYTVSAVLSGPKSLPVASITVDDFNGDGNLDIRSVGAASNHFYSHTWLGNGDGTFDAQNTQRSSNLKWWV